MDFWGHFLASHADAKAKLETLKAHHQPFIKKRKEKKKGGKGIAQ